MDARYETMPPTLAAALLPFQLLYRTLANTHALPLIYRRALHAVCRGRYEKASDEEVDARFGAMPAALAATLLPFQREGVRYALRRGGRALIADEMGVGKTVQAIALAACYMVRLPNQWDLFDVERAIRNLWKAHCRIP